MERAVLPGSMVQQLQSRGHILQGLEATLFSAFGLTTAQERLNLYRQVHRFSQKNTITEPEWTASDLLHNVSLANALIFLKPQFAHMASGGKVVMSYWLCKVCSRAMTS